MKRYEKNIEYIEIFDIKIGVLYKKTYLSHTKFI